jgi:hypothetical protein
MPLKDGATGNRITRVNPYTQKVPDLPAVASTPENTSASNQFRLEMAV